MSEADDLTARINQARANIESARQYLAEAGELSRAIRISTAEDVLGLIRNGISKTQLEARLIASDWHDVHGRLGSEQRVIWTNPSLEESVRIMTDEHGSSRARVFNGPTGGGRWGSERDPNAKNGKGGWTKPLVSGEQGLDLTGKPGPHNTTHHQLLPDPPMTQANIAENAIPSGGALRGAGRALGPLGVALDAYSLHEAYEADGGRMGENFKETAGGVVGGVVGGAVAGAAIGSVVPGVGTVVGGVVGGILGSMGGEWLGEKL